MARTVVRGAIAGALLCGLVVVAPPAGAAIRPPGNLAATALSSNTIELTWTDLSTDETGYEIQRSLSSTKSTFVTLTTTPAGATLYRNIGVAADTTYFYRVRARRNGSGSGWSGIVSARTPGGPTGTTPSITVQPTPKSVIAPATATFSVSATGTAPLSYQWQRNGSPIAGATSASYTTPATSTADNGTTFRVVVSNSAGSATSASATLTVTAPADTTSPVISGVGASGITQTSATVSWSTNEPADTDIWYGTTTGLGQATGINASLVTADSQPLSGLAPGTTYHYRVRSRDAVGNLTMSGFFSFTTTIASVGPAITTQPVSTSVTAPAPAMFSVTAAGTAPLSYQWQRNGAPIVGATAASYTTPATSTADNGATFRVVVSNSVSAATSNGATLTVAAPADTTPPTITVGYGPASPKTTDAVTLTATASDASGISAVDLSLDGVIVRTCGTSPCTFTTATGLTAGAHTYSATAADNSANHNIGRDPVSGTKSFTVTASSTFNPQLVSWLAAVGAATDVTVTGSTASIASGSLGLAIANVASATAPVVLGVSDRTFTGGHVATGGGRTIVTGTAANGTARLWVLDTAAAPRVVGELITTTPVGTTTGFLDVAVNAAGTRAVVAMGTAGLGVVDLANPAAPVLRSTFDTPGTAYGVALNPAAIASYAAGTLAYVTDGTGGLVTVNVTDVAGPVGVNTLATGGVLRDVAVSGTVAYIADQQGRLVTVNLVAPTAPLKLGELITGSSTFNVAVEGNRVAVYRISNGDYLQVVDVANPATPAKIGEVWVELQNTVKGLSLAGGRAYVAAGAQGVKIYDLTPTAIGQLKDSFVSSRVAANGVRAVVTGTHAPNNTARLRVVDTSNPIAPVTVGEMTSSVLVGTVTGFLDVAMNAAGTRAVVAMGNAGIGIVDLTNPATPVLRSTFDTPGTSYGVALDASGTLAYVADGTAGLRVVNIADATNPVLVGAVAPGGILRDVVVQGGVAYVADQANRFVTIDVTTPSAPVKLGELLTGGATFNVAVEGTRVITYHIAAGSDYLDVIDVGTPATPTRLGAANWVWAPQGAVKDLALSDGRAYVAASTQGLKIYDLANPAAPTLFGSGYAVGPANGVAVGSAYAWVADAVATVSTIDLF